VQSSAVVISNSWQKKVLDRTRRRNPYISHKVWTSTLGHPSSLGRSEGVGKIATGRRSTDSSQSQSESALSGSKVSAQLPVGNWKQSSC
jgi:hypothetical protein